MFELSESDSLFGEVTMEPGGPVELGGSLELSRSLELGGSFELSGSLPDRSEPGVLSSDDDGELSPSLRPF